MKMPLQLRCKSGGHAWEDAGQEGHKPRRPHMKKYRAAACAGCCICYSCYNCSAQNGVQQLQHPPCTRSSPRKKNCSTRAF